MKKQSLAPVKCTILKLRDLSKTKWTFLGCSNCLISFPKILISRLSPSETTLGPSSFSSKLSLTFFHSNLTSLWAY